MTSEGLSFCSIITVFVSVDISSLKTSLFPSLTLQEHCRIAFLTGGDQGSGPKTHQSDTAIPPSVPGQI